MTATTAAERLESLKAGLVGGAIAALTFILMLGLHRLLPDALLLSLTDLTASGWVSCAIAALSGFLFGVTYRYIIRQDNNPQLKAGAVSAFGLVRGLAQVDLGFAAGGSLLSLALMGIESVGLFAIAAFALEGAMRQGLIRAFGADEEPPAAKQSPPSA